MRTLFPGLTFLLFVLPGASAAPAGEWASQVRIPAYGDPIELPESREIPISYVCEAEDPCGLADYVRHLEPCALYVLHAGKVVYHSVWPDFGKDSDDGCEEKVERDRYNLASIAKSITSTLFGIFLQDPASDPIGLNTRVATALSAAGVKTYPDRDATLRHLLLMSSGMRWDEGREPRSVLRIEYPSGSADGYRTQTEAVAGRAPKYPNFDRSRPFHYSGFDSQVLGVLVEHRLKELNWGTPTLAGAVESELWKKLAMGKPADWNSDFAKSPAAHCCLHVSAGDMLKFGNWILQTLRTKSSLSDWIRKSVTDTVRSDLKCDFADYRLRFRYGYQWWIPAGEDDGFTGLGHGGQYLHLFPKQDVVIAQFGWHEPRDTKPFCEAMKVHRLMADAVSKQG